MLMFKDIHLIQRRYYGFEEFAYDHVYKIIVFYEICCRVYVWHYKTDGKIKKKHIFKLSKKGNNY